MTKSSIPLENVYLPGLPFVFGKLEEIWAGILRVIFTEEPG